MGKRFLSIRWNRVHESISGLSNCKYQRRIDSSWVYWTTLQCLAKVLFSHSISGGKSLRNGKSRMYIIYLFQYSRKVPSYSWQAYIANLRYSPAYSVTDGILNGILKSQVWLLIQCFVYNKVMSIIEKHNASCCLQHDGLKLKPALEYCQHYLSVIGLSSGLMAYEEIEEICNLGDKERRKKVAGLPSQQKL